MARPPEVDLIGYEELPAPGRPVAPSARPVHGKTDHLAGKPVFGHGAHDVGVVVLNADDLVCGSSSASLVVQ